MGWARKHPVFSAICGVVLALVIFAGIVGKKSSQTSATLTTVTVVRQPAPKHQRRHSRPKAATPKPSPTTTRSCSRVVKAGGETSCPFAQNVFTAVVSGEQQTGGALPASVTAYSPATHQSYSLACVVSSGEMSCTDPTGSLVVFSVSSAQGAPPTTTPTATTPAPSPAVEAPGSYSHDTDAEFCASGHSCIENFPNGNGSIVQCADGDWSHSGGIQGACSDHGGEQ